MHDTRPGDGRADFDFPHGDWAIRNRRLARRLAGSSEWQEFQSTASVRPILGGLGNIDSIAGDMPGVGAFECFTVRLFDPRRRLWSIHWASTLAPGHLDPPLTGRHAIFEGEDTFRVDRFACGWSGTPASGTALAGSRRSRSTTARPTKSTGRWSSTAFGNI